MKALINFYASVSEESVNNLIGFMTQQTVLGIQHKENPLDEVIIQISSSGGSSDHGLLAYNYLKQLNIPKITIGMGNVDSAAVMIFAAGDKRLTMPSCRFLLHEAVTNIGGSFNGTKLHEIAYLNERITKDYCEVISKVTSKPLKTVQKKVKDGQVMSSVEAKEYGLVQEILENPYLTNLNGLNILMINNPSRPVSQKPNNGTSVEN
jgi:ATP-dependent Clp protease protease subunit